MSLAPPTATVHPKHTVWLCEKDVNGKCKTRNDVNDLMCRNCYYEVDGRTKVRAEDKDEIEIGQLHSYEDGVAKWQYYVHFLNTGPIMEDAPGNNCGCNQRHDQRIVHEWRNYQRSYQWS
ncbi:hypothetical protein FPHYL_832 [Fusarium phyllophilum]|uniref:Uncharacterized protein n=1 Tax=Fusarium phyllophilum TaxID=47803 RepID=A0A8H5NLK5_9HYPO|nr:hypothetical protein FPHYL_832 [Fusarium phyllophilum]